METRTANVPQIDHYYIATLKYGKGSGGPPGTGAELPGNQKQYYAATSALVEGHTFNFTLGEGHSKHADYKFLGWSIGGAYYSAGSTYSFTATIPYATSSPEGEVINAAARWEYKSSATCTIIYHYIDGSTSTIRTTVYGFIGDLVDIELLSVPHKTYHNDYWANSGGNKITSLSVPAWKNSTYDLYETHTKKYRYFEYFKNLDYTVNNLPSKATVYCGDDYTIPSTVPTVSNNIKIFYRWNKKADGSGTFYKGGDIISRSDTSATTKLYAIWKYNFIYKPDSNSKETSNVVSRVEPGKSITIQSKFTHKDDAAYDYEIDYYVAGSKKYYVGTSYTLTGDVEATVHWKQKEKEYAVEYNANTSDSSVKGIPDTQYKKHTSNLTLSSSQPTRTGYNFLNWNTRANGSGTTYNPGDIYSKNEAITLYAQWEKKNITITYKLNGGSGTLPGNNGEVIIEHGWGTNITLDTSYYPNLTKKYYKCLGWNTNKNASSPIATLTNVTADNTDVFAIWTKKTLQVRYESDGVTVSDGNKDQGSKYITKDDNDSAISGFRREGASLFGWAKTENSPTRYCALGEEITLPNQNDNSTFTLYPYWRDTFDAYYCKHITTTRGRRIIYQEDYIKKGGF